MRRITAILGLGLVGFVIGFIGFLALDALKEVLIQIYPTLLNVEGYLLSAIVAGVVGSIVTVVAVVVWSYSSKHY
ncbi:MAG: hypothetical protein L6M37_04460 [Candidatus Methylarchaceae archaeon HK02M1]|nr:hypothetical protein [Candidatus Methylarchaceae archaeon HK01M]MCP8312186.1 hypothetical protein [Candidatus Methylarchaceae archaeon HK02M1]